MEKRDYGILGSSEDPSKIGDTVKGIIVALSSIIILVGSQFNVTLEQSQVVEIATALGGAVGAIWTLYGLLKKVLVKIA